MMFTYVASPSQSGNQNVRRVCSNSKCGGTMYVTHGADNYRCPHCDHRQ
jgi:NADH pyrophosphatase NudC (nudix superfamily)